MISFLFSVVQSGTPILFATLGEIITEKVGNLNLGVEGMMLMGAVAGFFAGFLTGNPILALTCAFLAGALGGLLYAFVTVSLRANQVVTGLSLTILGTGICGFAGKFIMGQSVSEAFKSNFQNFDLPLLSKIPFIGDIMFKQNIYVYLSYLLVIVLTIYMNYTRFGLNLQAVGHNPAAADASGISVSLYKYIHIALGGGLCGLGGAYLSLVYIPSWQENVVAGRGWIAIALVIFSMWRMPNAILGSYFFGALSILGFKMQSMNVHISPYIFDMAPYVMTLIVLIVVSMNKNANFNEPEGLSVSYFREDRY